MLTNQLNDLIIHRHYSPLCALWCESSASMMWGTLFRIHFPNIWSGIHLLNVRKSWENFSYVKIVSSSHPCESSSAFLGFQPCCMIASSCRNCTDTWRESTDHFPANRKRKELQCHNRNLKCRLRAIYESNKARRAHGRSDESCTWETVRCPPAIASGERARNG